MSRRYDELAEQLDQLFPRYEDLDGIMQAVINDVLAGAAARLERDRINAWGQAKRGLHLLVKWPAGPIRPYDLLHLTRDLERWLASLPDGLYLRLLRNRQGDVVAIEQIAAGKITRLPEYNVWALGSARAREGPAIYLLPNEVLHVLPHDMKSSEPIRWE
jgi:hypothetical protein